jgi:hypothetical protein
MFEWIMEYSETTRNGTRIQITMGEACVDAETEEEARQIMAEEMPNAEINSIVKGEKVGD